MKAILIPVGQRLDVAKLRRAIENTIQGAAEGVLVDLQATTEYWERKPSFTIVRAGPARRVVGTDDQVYAWVNDGTDGPYPITANGRKPLAFAVGGTPKTRPGRLVTTRGTPGGSVVRARRVMHPGITARQFTLVAKRKWDKRLPDLMQRAIDAVV